MNAVTTAEYVVVYEVYLKKYQEKLTLHAEQGFRVVSTQAIVDPAEEEVVFTAVMVREPLNAAIASDFIGHFMVLATRVEALDSKQDYYLKRIEELENRLHRLEDQMTDHLRTY